MAKPDHSLDAKILESAKVEFLALGFEKASLKSICQRAEVTTGAIYKRYRGKDELFGALVTPVIAAMTTIVDEKCSQAVSELSDKALVDAWNMDETYLLWWFEFLYQHHDAFVLLIKCAEGSSYSNFQHEWVEKMNIGTYDYFAEAKRRGLAKREVSTQEMHMLVTAFWATIYEPFIHGYDWAQMESHCKIVSKLFCWHKALEFL